MTDGALDFFGFNPKRRCEAMTQSNTVTVIVPTYNRARFVGAAIESILAQTRPADEVVVVDDGSTDDTQQALACFQDKITVVVQENQGVSAARNAGVRKASGDWVAFLDSDDEWNEDKLAHQFEGLSTFPDAVAHLTNCYSERVRETTLFEERKMLSEFGDQEQAYFDRPLRMNLKYNFGRVQSLLAKRQAVLDAGLFDLEMNLFEDTAFLNRLALEGPWVVSRKPCLAEIRRVEADIGLGLQKVSRPYVGYENLAQSLEALRGCPGLTAAEIEEISAYVSRYNYQAGTSYFRAGELKAARANLRKAIASSHGPKALFLFAMSYAPTAIAGKLFR